MKNQRFITKLFISYIGLAVGVILLIILFASGAIKDFYVEQRTEDLRIRSQLMEVILHNVDLQNGPELQQVCSKIGESTDTRITVIGMDGKVLADSEEDPATMDLHNDRPEIIQAMETGEGISERFSFTLDQDYLYYAKRIDLTDSRYILRTSFSTINLDRALNSIQREIQLIGAILLILTALVNWYIARSITKPIQVMESGARRFAKGKLKAKIPEFHVPEFDSLGNSLNEMAEDIYSRIRTITQQKNEQLTILSSMSEGVIALSKEMEILSINKSAAQMFGVKAKKCAGRKLHEVIRYSDLNDFIELLFSGDKIRRSKLSLTSPEERILNIVGSRMPSRKNEPAGAVIVLTDLTQMMKLEGIRRDFVANVSHELKTPITSIQGYVETLQEGAIRDPVDAEKFLNIVSKHADRLGQIIDDLLQLSRVEESVEFDDQSFKNCLVSKLFEDALLDLEPLIDQTQTRVIVDVDEELPVNANRKMMVHALKNLIENAIKYSDVGSEVKLEGSSKGKKVIIEIRDWGIGIEQSQLDRIFERFYRVDKGRSREVGGTGLGLSLVKHIARIHKADLEVDSTHGEGSVFRLIF